MTHSRFWSMPAYAAVALLGVASCKKDSGPSSDNQVTSLLFDAASPAAREALATPVSYRLTEANYAQWEQAQRFLDAVPRSAFASASGAGGNAIDRAVATLEASPRARTSIERTGLSVRDFVLETVALAQAAEAGAGNPPGGVTVPPENIQFVQRYQSRIMQARAMRARADAYDGADTAGLGVQSSTETTPEETRAQTHERVTRRSSSANGRAIRRGARDKRPTNPSSGLTRSAIPYPDNRYHLACYPSRLARPGTVPASVRRLVRHTLIV